MAKKNVKKENKKSKKIFILILMILFSGVVLTSSTYAWFTANKRVTVKQLDVNVTASDGFQVSVDATNWKTVISTEDINGASATYSSAVNQLPAGQIYPVSTIGEVDDTSGFMKMFKGVTTDDSETGNFILTATQSTETHGTTSGDFIAFDLFFQTNQATSVYLTSNSNVIAKGESTGIENASRVAFVVQGNSPAGTATATVQALKAAAGTAPFIWEPNYDVHTAAGVKNAYDVYGLTTTETGGSKLAYNGVKAAIDAAAKVGLNSDDANYFSAVTPTLSTTATGILSTKYEKVFDLEAGITKVRVYMWVEGQDVDCEDNASNGSLSYNLQFSTLDKA